MVRVVAFFGGKCQSWLCQDKTIPSGIEFIVSISRRERTEMSLLGVDERADTILLFRWLEAQTPGLEFRRLRFSRWAGELTARAFFRWSDSHCHPPPDMDKKLMSCFDEWTEQTLRGSVTDWFREPTNAMVACLQSRFGTKTVCENFQHAIQIVRRDCRPITALDSAERLWNFKTDWSGNWWDRF